MSNPDWVRVRDTRTGHHLTVTAKQAEKSHFVELKQSAVDRNGNPLPAKPKVSLPNAQPSAGDTKPTEGDTTEKEKK